MVYRSGMEAGAEMRSRAQTDKPQHLLHPCSHMQEF